MDTTTSTVCLDCGALQQPHLTVTADLVSIAPGVSMMMFAVTMYTVMRLYSTASLA